MRSNLHSFDQSWSCQAVYLVMKKSIRSVANYISDYTLPPGLLELWMMNHSGIQDPLAALIWALKLRRKAMASAIASGIVGVLGIALEWAMYHLAGFEVLERSGLIPVLIAAATIGGSGAFLLILDLSFMRFDDYQLGKFGAFCDSAAFFLENAITPIEKLRFYGTGQLKAEAAVVLAAISCKVHQARKKEGSAVNSKETGAALESSSDLWTRFLSTHRQFVEAGLAKPDWAPYHDAGLTLAMKAPEPQAKAA